MDPMSMVVGLVIGAAVGAGAFALKSKGPVPQTGRGSLDGRVVLTGGSVATLNGFTVESGDNKHVDLGGDRFCVWGEAGPFSISLDTSVGHVPLSGILEEGKHLVKDATVQP